MYMIILGLTYCSWLLVAPLPTVQYRHLPLFMRISLQSSAVLSLTGLAGLVAAGPDNEILQDSAQSILLLNISWASRHKFQPLSWTS